MGQHVVHRDIKPSNFLLTHKDSRLIVKLSDFGLAIRQEDSAEFRLTKDKSTVGTVDYMSPEQATDSRAVDIRRDIYSLGCTFFHMLAGEAPFSKGSLPERIVQHMQQAPPDLRAHNKLVPRSFVAIINRMLEKNPADRYQTPTELLKDLERPDRVLRSKPAVGKLEQPGPKTTGAGTDEFDKVQPSVAKATSVTKSVESAPRKVQPSVAKVETDAEPVDLVAARSAAWCCEDPNQRRAGEFGAAQGPAQSCEGPARGRVGGFGSRLKCYPALQSSRPKPMQSIWCRWRRFTQGHQGPARTTTPWIWLARSRSMEPPRPRRRTDPAMKVQVEPAAATKMRFLETDEIETPRSDKPKKKSTAANSPGGCMRPAARRRCWA